MLVPLFILEFFQPLFWGALAGLMLLAWGVGAFAEALALAEHADARLTLAAWSWRLLAVFFWILWLNASLARERSERFDQVLFSLPRSRFHLLAQRLAGWMAVAGLIGMLSGLFMLLLGATGDGALKWALSFTLELWLTGAMTLFVAASLTNASAAMMISLLFYLFLRLLTYAAALAEHALDETSEGLAQAVQHVLSIMLWLFPALDQFAVSSWLLNPPDWQQLGEQSMHVGLFMLLLLFAAGHDINRRAIA